MDNSFSENLFKNEKKDQINIFNTNSNNIEEVRDISVINITKEREAIEHERKVYGERVMFGMIDDPTYFTVKEEDYRLKNTIESYLPELISDNYRIKGKKSEVDKITDKVTTPYRFGFKSMVAKGKEAWHSYKLKKEFTQTYKDKKTLIKSKLESGNFEEDENEESLNEELNMTEQTIDNCPKFDETTYKFRKGVQAYNEEKANEEHDENKKNINNNLNLVLERSMSFHFKAALCNESYMTTHYHDLRKNIDQSILLPELMKRDGKYWDSLSQDMKDMIELQAKTAQCFKKLFIEFGKKHHIDAMTGNFYVGKFDNDDYLIAKNEYQKILRENYITMSDIKEKRSLPSSNKFEDLYKSLAMKAMEED